MKITKVVSDEEVAVWWFRDLPVYSSSEGEESMTSLTYKYYPEKSCHYLSHNEIKQIYIQEFL